MFECVTVTFCVCQPSPHHFDGKSWWYATLVDTIQKSNTHRKLYQDVLGLVHWIWNSWVYYCSINKSLITTTSNNIQAQPNQQLVDSLNDYNINITNESLLIQGTVFMGAKFCFGVGLLAAATTICIASLSRCLLGAPSLGRTRRTGSKVHLMYVPHCTLLSLFRWSDTGKAMVSKW